MAQKTTKTKSQKTAATNTVKRASTATNAKKSPRKRSPGGGESSKNPPRLTREEKARLEKIEVEKKAAAAARRKNFSEQYMPYILGAVGFLMLVFFTVHLICGAEDPADHWMGPVGYWFSYFFFGLFGWPAYCIPVLLIYLAAFWRKNCREETVTLRVVLSVVLMVMISAVVHVFACQADDSFAELNIGMLYQSGAAFECGGVVGGLLGFLLYHGLKLWGTILVSVLLFPLLIMFLVGVTPAYVAQKIREWVISSREAKAEREVEEARAALDRSEMPLTQKKKILKEAPVSEEDDHEISRKRPKNKDRSAGERTSKTVLVNVDTGEVLRQGATEDDNAEFVPPSPKNRERANVERTTERTASAEAKPHEEGQRTVAETEVSEIEEEALARADQETPPEETSAENELGKGTEDQEEETGASTLYVPEKRTPKQSREMRERLADQSRNTAAEETFVADDAPEKVSTLEIFWDDENDGAETVVVNARQVPPRATSEGAETSASVASNEKASTPEPEKIVVVVNRQETAAVTSTTDRHVEGLPEEETVLPIEKKEGEAVEHQEYMFPPLDLLVKGPARYEADEDEIIRNTQTLRSVLESFHIRVKEITCSCGPTITRYEVKPDTGVRVRSIANLVDDIALGLAKSGVRIEAPIPGKAAVGIEVPNDKASLVAVRNLLETPEFMNHKSRLQTCLGADVAGRPVMMDINKMPHLLVAGTTGSGKSVCINSIIMSILYKAKPDEVKLILIDPKKVEFAVYRDLPHLYCPLISDPKKAAGALNSAVSEMEHRFELIEEMGVRNLAGYNEAIAGDPDRQPLPQMVIIIDELADLMMTASNEVETAICRLAQKARAAGIHLILGTQRPSVDVITGLIKANVPSRIAFTVASAVDSRTIIDMVGAEKLIGLGDMLYSPVGCNKPMRVQGAFVSDSEVERVVTFLKENNVQTEYDESFMHQIEVEAAKCGQGKKKGGDVGSPEDFGALGGSDEDSKYWAAVEVAVEERKISTSLLQRRLNLGYGRAAKIIDRMEEMGFVGPKDGNKPRNTLITAHDLAEIRISGRADEASEE